MGSVCALGVTVLALAAGCGGDPAPATDAPPPPPDAPACVPLAACGWLDAYQREVVETLGGTREIAPGVWLDHRANPTERMLTRQYLRDAIAQLGLSPMEHTYATGANVLATLDATTGTGGLVIVGAHFDSVPAGPGAADNATGVAIVLAAARYLRDLPARHHPVVFALFDEEELGLIGSRAYAQTLVTAGTEVTGVHVFDMLSFDGDGDRAVELWSPSPALEALYTQQGALAQLPISAVTFAYSDHQAFLDVGLPAVGVGEEFVAGDHTPHYHKATDTVPNVSFAHLATVTHLALAALEASVTTP